MTKHRAQWIGGSLLLCLAGCPDDGGGNTVGPVPSDEAPQTAVSVICGAFDDCGCDPQAVAPQGCDARIDEQVRQAQGDAVALGLEYDAACMGNMLTTVREVGCERASDYTIEELVTLLQRYQCKLFYGTATPGEACEAVQDLGDSCDRNSTCVDGLCVARPETAAEGETCDVQLDFFSVCVTGTYCVDVDDDGQARCVRLPKVGDACLGTAQICDEELSCVDGTCALAPGDGEPCHQGGGAACGHDLVCELESVTCVAAPTGGEACLFSCATGFECDQGRCVVEEALVCDVDLYDVEGQG
ncbi:MAG: hypothetical protein H6712_11315 [Myxococcales bacterium]|nr:hypothetical protein [Myxococcales bacterium]MCB9714441.1 hypothetical protein [Myxococcales bacterium]